MSTTVRLPVRSIRKLVCNKLGTNFNESVSLEKGSIEQLAPNSVLVRNHYLGINASDVNFTAGRYQPGIKPPFDIGFEAIGEIAAVGTDVRSVKVGQPVAYMKYGAFSNYMELNEKQLFPVPSCRPEYLVLLVSGLTASICLSEVAELKPKQVVLVTAAAGGTGHIAVQLAKMKDCHVIGTCSTEEKVKVLRQLGCHRVINYKQENLDTVLRNEYPTGVDVVYESIGGQVFDTCLKNLSKHGKLCVIGYIAGYTADRGFIANKTPIAQRILPLSASVRGFFLFNHFRSFHHHFQRLVGLCQEDKLKCLTDRGAAQVAGPFLGLDSVKHGVAYLYSQTSRGKVVVQLSPEDFFPDSKL